jgi:hypothetical protein
MCPEKPPVLENNNVETDGHLVSPKTFEATNTAKTLVYQICWLRQ